MTRKAMRQLQHKERVLRRKIKQLSHEAKLHIAEQYRQELGVPDGIDFFCYVNDEGIPEIGVYTIPYEMLSKKDKS